MSKNKKSNQTNLIIVVASSLAAVSFYAYRYMLNPVSINQIGKLSKGSRRATPETLKQYIDPTLPNNGTRFDMQYAPK